jgi:hypothetical protein
MKPNANNMDTTDGMTGSGLLAGVIKFRMSKGSDTYQKTLKSIAEYAGTEFGHETRVLISQGQESIPVIPQLPPNPTEQDKLKWSKDHDMAVKDEKLYNEHKGKLFAKILSMCDAMMKLKVESLSHYDKMERDRDVVTLVAEIKTLAYSSSSKKQYIAEMAVINIKQIMGLHQWEQELLVEYYNRFNDAIDRLETTFGDFYHTVMVTVDKRKINQEKKMEEAKEKSTTQLFIQSCLSGF